MKDIIAEAHKSRYTVADDDPKKQGIAISESWLAELEKHPYHSSKDFKLNIYRETWHWNIPDEGELKALSTS